MMRRTMMTTLLLASAGVPGIARAQACINADSEARIVMLSASDDFGAENGLGFANPMTVQSAKQIEMSGSAGMPVVLVLSARSPKIWNLENVDKSLLRGVVMIGSDQAVAGILPSVPVASMRPAAMINPFGNRVSLCPGTFAGFGGEVSRQAVRAIARETRLTPLGFTALLKGSSFDLSRPDSTGNFRWGPVPVGALVSTAPIVPYGTDQTGTKAPAGGDLGAHMVAWDDRGNVVRESFPDSSRGATPSEAMAPIGALGVNSGAVGRPQIDPFQKAIDARPPMMAPSERTEREWSWSMALLGLVVAAMAGAALIIIRIGKRIADHQVASATHDEPTSSPGSATASETSQEQRVRREIAAKTTPKPLISPTMRTDQTLKLLLDHVSDDDTVLALSRVRRSARTSTNLDEDLAEERDRIVGPHLSGLVDRYVAAARAPGADGPGVESMLRDSLQRLLAALEALNEAQRKRGVDGLATSREFIRRRHPARNDDGGIGPVD